MEASVDPFHEAETTAEVQRHESELIAKGWRYWPVEVTTRVDVLMPRDSTAESVAFRYNEGTWCAENLPDMMQSHISRYAEGTQARDITHERLDFNTTVRVIGEPHDGLE